jgi:hypothetical protein
MESKEVRVRLKQEEIRILLKVGSLKEDIFLPACKLSFQIAFDKRSRITQNENVVTFWLSPDVRDKLNSSIPGKDPIATVCEEINGNLVCFKLEVDVFNSKKREQRI